MDPRLEEVKNFKRAMQSYVYMLYEFVLEAKWDNVLEIGVQMGQSTRTILFAMAQNKKGKLISIDIKNRSNLLTRWGAYRHDLPQYWHFIRGSSLDESTFQAAKNALKEGEMYDMLFIDGSHTYHDVKHDFQTYSQLVKPGGVIMLHDVTNRRAGVKEFWPEITWEKFVIDWGKAGNRVIPGMGLVKKPKNEFSE